MVTLARALHDQGRDVAFLTRADTISNRRLKATQLPCFVIERESVAPSAQDVARGYEPDLVIQDVLETAPDDLRPYNEAGVACVNFDDTGAGLALAAAVINSIVFHWGEYDPERCKAELFEGPQYMVLQEEVNELREIPRSFPSRAERVLMAFGGTDTHDVTERMLAGINGVTTPLSVRVNLGPGREMTDGLAQAIGTSRHRVEVTHSVPSLLREFVDSDFVICGGGNMLYEVAALGVPAASLATEVHEIRNVAYWADVGSTLNLGHEGELEPHRMCCLLDNLLGSKRDRQRMAVAGREVVDGKGLARVLGIINGFLN